jgi:septal ring factor EnvC (AmiA/AmiB activator)
MNGMKVPLAIVMAIAIQAGAMLWYVSGIDHRVNTMYTEYQQSNQKAVIENQVRMEMNLQQVMKALTTTALQVDKLTNTSEKLKKSNATLVKQNKQIKTQLNNIKKQINQSNTKKKKKNNSDKKLG